MAKLYQIHESDLVDLERLVPELGDALATTLDNRLKVKLRKCKQILSDIRWNYGPPDEVSVIPAGPDDE